MKQLLLILALSTFAMADEAITAESRPALTIYNQNFFVAREHLPLDLKPGANHIAFTGVAAHIEPDSVILRDPAGRALQVLEQNYRNDPVSQELLLSFYEGKTIDFLIQPGEIVKGKIIRSGYIPSYTYANAYPQQPAYSQPIIEIDGVLRFGLPGQPMFPALSGDAILQPTLSWLLQSDKPGAFTAEVSYVSGGMNWHADYNLVVSDASANQTNLVDLVGWITMQNQSGKTFENAQIKLMAGDVNKLLPAAPMMKAVAGALRAAEDRAENVVQEKSFDEFHLYTLERPTTINDQETKQVEFVSAAGIHAQRLYIYDGAQTAQYAYYNPEQIRQDPNYGTQSNNKVWVMQEFKNSEANHLGLPLPKGRLRFYRRDTDGHLEFIGENSIDHTPKDETLRLYTGNAFDIVGERRRTNYHIESNQHWIDESFEIRVRNHKKDPATVRVVEHLYRCNNWKLTEPSTPSHKTDANTVEFPITVKPDGEALVTYTVHYSW